MKNVSVGLRPLVSNLNMPTVIKTATLPGDREESLFIATQVGEIFSVKSGTIDTFLDIRPLIIKLGASGGSYDERGLVGLAFHPDFNYNGLFYLHYSVAGTQGPGPGNLPSSRSAASDIEERPEPFQPDPCLPETLSLKWIDRDTSYDHIDTVEEWGIRSNGRPERLRTLLNIRRPFFNHNGVNSLNFSPETGRLVLTTGDGGMGYDPFNLAQNDMEIAGKIIEIDITVDTEVEDPPVATRFDELPPAIQETMTVITKGVRNIPGISYQPLYQQYLKYVGIVGQDLVESVFSFLHYQPVPVTRIVEASASNIDLDQEGLVNFGWRGWEGAFPTTIIRDCSGEDGLEEQTIAYYNDAVITSSRRLPPLISYFHQDPRPGKFGGTALTGVQVYLGNGIPELTGSVVFTDFARNGEPLKPPVRGVLANAWARLDCKLNDYNVLDIDYDFGSESAFFASLGANSDQTRLYLGVYGSMNVTEFGKGTVYEII